MENQPKNVKRKKVKEQELYRHGRGLTTVPAKLVFDHLTAIYFHNNNIARMEHLQNATKLSILYLQNNKIAKIMNLDKLLSLKKLFLGNNEISVVENLPPNLEELHIEKQRLKEGESLCFDPRTVSLLTSSLVVLNISENHLKSILCFKPLNFLRVLISCNNEIKSIHDIVGTIKDWFYLSEVNFAGNPVTKVHRYKDSIIAKTIDLKLLDLKSVSEITRSFMKQFEKEKNNLRKKPINLSNTYQSLPKNYSESLQKAVSDSIIQKGLSVWKEGDTPVYLPQKALTKKLKPKRSKDVSTVFKASAQSKE